MTPRLQSDASTPIRRALRLAFLALFALLGPLTGLQSARADDDHDRAREALRAGQVLPLHVVLERLQPDHPGRVLDVELERDRAGRWVYEIRLLQTGGRRVKLDVDAATGKVLQRRERGAAPAASGAQ
jgi:hypothetical protein